MASLRSAWPFTEPVDAEEVPDYYEVITKPMDLGTIQRRLQVGRRLSLSDAPGRFFQGAVE